MEYEVPRLPGDKLPGFGLDSQDGLVLKKTTEITLCMKVWSGMAVILTQPWRQGPGEWARALLTPALPLTLTLCLCASLPDPEL